MSVMHSEKHLTYLSHVEYTKLSLKYLWVFFKVDVLGFYSLKIYSVDLKLFLFIQKILLVYDIMQLRYQ